MNFYEMLKSAVSSNASDIHLASGNYPALRINGDIVWFGECPLTRDVVDSVIKRCLTEEKFAEFMNTGDADHAVDIPDVGRFRVNAFKQNSGTTIVLRTVNSKTPDMKELNLPIQMSKILELKQGLVLVTGPTGSGKSTTLAAIINEFNKNRKSHIITIEDPIEYIHVPGTCIINQREVGKDSRSYATALRVALREDPDIILVGEMRDLESISIALTAAENGHLVLSTLHTIGAVKTIDRLVDVFPTEQQQQIKIQLSMALKAVISQRLLPRADGKGRVGAFEIMYSNNDISNLIREGKSANIQQVIQTNYSYGMMTMEKNIRELQENGYLTKKMADASIEEVK